MVSLSVPRVAAIALLILPACTIQRAPAMSRPAVDEPAKAAASRAAAAPPEVAHAPTDEPVVTTEPVAGSDIVQAHAVVLVRAPIARVRGVLLDCPRYPEIIPSYRSCADLGAGPSGGRAFRMEIEEMGGMLKLWMRIEIVKREGPGAAEVYEGRLVEGNIRSFTSRWHLEPTPAGHTRLSLWSHLDPALPLPSSLINGGSVDGIRDAILAFKRRAERGGPGVAEVLSDNPPLLSDNTD